MKQLYHTKLPDERGYLPKQMLDIILLFGNIYIDMKYSEIIKMIEGYPAKTELDRSVKELLKTTAQRAYSAGKMDGMNDAIEMVKRK